jgi:hypothetical protein
MRFLSVTALPEKLSTNLFNHLGHFFSILRFPHPKVKPEMRAALNRSPLNLP